VNLSTHAALALAPALALAVALVLLIPACGKKNVPSGNSTPNPASQEGGSGRPPVPQPVDDPTPKAPVEPVTSPDGTPISTAKPAASPTPDRNNPPTIRNTPNSQQVRVWFATNRAPVDPREPSKGFTNQRDPDPSQLHLGSVVCDVPNARPIGSVGSSWLTRVVTGEDDRITITKLLITDHDTYFAQIAQRLAQAPARERAVLVYIHGYKNSFESAALRAAQLAVDLRVPGLTAFYSWPSKDALAEYNADEAAVETAEKHLEYFLRRLATDSNATHVHVIAHSMGNRVLARVMQRLASISAPETQPVKFGQIILAAPDIDTQVFLDLARAYPKLSQRTTLYISRKDMALEASAWSHSFPRAGYAPPVAILPPIDTVEVTSVDLSVLGHGYVAQAQRVLDDVASLLRNDRPPSERDFIQPAQTPQGDRYWHLMDPTPSSERAR
jgi:esterase/lipase superfamily enzyme